MLKVISSSSGELEPVFEAILENATRICQARFANLDLYDGNFFRRVAIHNPTPQFAMMLGEVIRPHPESGFGTVVRTKQIAHIDDVRTRRPYLEGDEANVKFVDRSGARTVLAVPMLKNDELLGLIAIFRLPTSRLTSSRTSPRRRSSPSRTRGCSTSCAGHYSNRPLPPTCSKLSAPLQASSNRFSMPSLGMRRKFARHGLVL